MENQEITLEMWNPIAQSHSFVQSYGDRDGCTGIALARAALALVEKQFPNKTFRLVAVLAS